MKAVHHIVSGNLNIDEIVNETEDAFEWFPELKDNNIFKHFKIKCLTVDMEITNHEKQVTRAYFEIFPDNLDEPDFRPSPGEVYAWTSSKYDQTVRIFIAGVTRNGIATEIRRPEKLKGRCDFISLEGFDLLVKSGVMKKM